MAAPDDDHESIEETETDPFGPEPTIAVFTPLGNPTAGYSEPWRWGRRQDGRSVRLDVQGKPAKRVR